MPTYDNKLALSRRGTGNNGHAARRVGLEHEALAYVFADWEERTREGCMLYCGGLEKQKSKIYLAALVVDHLQLDKFAAGGMSLSHVCISCFSCVYLVVISGNGT